MQRPVAPVNDISILPLKISFLLPPKETDSPNNAGATGGANGIPLTSMFVAPILTTEKPLQYLSTSTFWLAEYRIGTKLYSIIWSTSALYSIVNILEVLKCSWLYHLRPYRLNDPAAILRHVGSLTNPFHKVD